LEAGKMVKQSERKRIMEILMKEEDRFFENNEHDKALTISDLAIKIDPNDSRPWHNKGAVLFGKGKFKEALFEFDMSLRLKKTSNTLYMKSLCLFELKRYKETYICLSEAIEIEGRKKPRDKILLVTMLEMILEVTKHIKLPEEKNDSSNLDNIVERTLYKKKEPDFDKVTFVSEDGESWATIEKKRK
jgi:tetratricopeptide (TPR) repeat protein